MADLEPIHDSVEEQWRPIPGWEGWYSASSLGRVRSEARVTMLMNGGRHTRKGKILSLGKTVGGYAQFHARKPGISKMVLVNRAVLSAFSMECRNLECRHMNGVKTDNRLANLAWGTRQANVADGHRHGLWEQQRHAAKLSVEQVRAIASSTAPRRTLMVRYSVSWNTVDRIRRGLTWRTETEGIRTYL